MAVTKGYVRIGGETCGLCPITRGLEAFALMMCEGIVTSRLFGFPCHRRRRLSLSLSQPNWCMLGILRVEVGDDMDRLPGGGLLVGGSWWLDSDGGRWRQVSVQRRGPLAWARSWRETTVMVGIVVGRHHHDQGVWMWPGQCVI